MGLPQIRVGDPVGGSDAAAGQHHFPPPALAAAVAPRRPEQGAGLLAALTQLAEQDPLINVRRDGDGGEIRVSLYGEVQKQVIQATLASDYGIEADFRESSTVCVERPAGTGEAVEILFAESNPFLATVGLRVEPAPPGSGVEFRLRVDFRSVPLFVYKSREAFGEAMEQYVRAALREGRYGWEVTDCVVSLVECGYSSPDGPPATRGPLSAAADFRKLTPLVLRQALEQAGTVVCEPVLRVHLEIPAGSVGAVLTELARLDAAMRGQSTQRQLATVAASLPAARIPDLQRQLPRLTSGEGVLESAFEGYRPVRRIRLR